MTSAIRRALRKTLHSLFILSLKKALAEQKFTEIYNKLSHIVSDISDQYSTFAIDNRYLETKVRAQHSFQIALFRQAFELIDHSATLSVVDIGDSSGTHIQYINSLFPKNIKALSVNLDKDAVERIKRKGLTAIQARAEDLEQYNISADIFTSFEMLEHLSDPVGFLHKIAQKTDCKYFVITVPYLAKSRVGLHHIRHGRAEKISAEKTHVFELSPSDWKLIFRHSGWSVTVERIYYQYPRRSWIRILKPIWRHYDFEGFFGVILKKDSTWSNLYQDWPA